MSAAHAVNKHVEYSELDEAEERLRKAIRFLEWRVQQLRGKLEHSTMQIHLRYQEAATPPTNLFGEPATVSEDTTSLLHELESVQRYDQEMRRYVRELLVYLGTTIRELPHTQPIAGAA